MKKCAIIIGVNKTGGLQPLTGAVSGAQDFADWATAQGFDIELLTDATAPVTLSDIKAAVKKYVSQMTYSQMIIFFSGHGILKGPSEELWLLSHAPGDTIEAVNLLGSVNTARSVGIPHLVFISDACRSVPDYTLMQMTGGNIFPNDVKINTNSNVDIFYATRPGDPSFEVSLDQSILRTGIFTRCLLEGLNGKEPSVVKSIPETAAGPVEWVIPAYELKTFLEVKVPEEISEVNITLSQEPDIRVESRMPKYLGKIHPTPAELQELEAATDDNTRGGLDDIFIKNTTKPPAKVNDQYLLYEFIDENEMDKVFEVLAQNKTIYKGFQDLRDEYIYDNPKGLDLQRFKTRLKTFIGAKSTFFHQIDAVAAAKGRDHFETMTGFTIVGGRITGAQINKGYCQLFEEADFQQIRVDAIHESQSVLIVLQNGNSIPLAVVQGFIGTVVLEADKLLTVNYTPSTNNYNRYVAYKAFEEPLEQRRALVATAARHGLNLQDAKGAGDFLRQLKSFDPSLGLYASYAYAQSGMTADIVSVYHFMAEEPESLLFDVALLAGQLEGQTRPVTPFCPMLTQGWSYLDTYREQLPPVVQEAAKSLVPGLWTTFNPTGTDLLINSIQTI